MKEFPGQQRFRRHACLNLCLNLDFCLFDKFDKYFCVFIYFRSEQNENEPIHVLLTHYCAISTIQNGALWRHIRLYVHQFKLLKLRNCKYPPPLFHHQISFRSSNSIQGTGCGHFLPHTKSLKLVHVRQD